MTLRERIRGGERAFGVFLEIPSPEPVEIAALAGWDFAVVDCEHAPLTPAELPAMMRAADARRMAAIVRVPSNDPVAIQHALDAGAAGVQVPQIVAAEQARAAVRASRFHPHGLRGFNPFVRASGYGAEPVAEFVRRSGEEVLVVLQLENADALPAAEAICAAGGTDVLFIGPYDLSQSLGVPGEVSHPKVREAAAQLIAASSRHGVAVGVFANTEPELAAWAELGVRYLCYSIDTVLLSRAMRDSLASLKKALVKHT